ncbi:Peroxisomal multifunctional enzyme type 2 [Aphelenchoides fujianensis]|nr:Peroxisomal multifunctional enzyme type 2 [Aphelenchoides fujianensis]
MAAMKFGGQVAVITGAGGGLGRAYALELAQRGAAVVVNDWGGDKRGAAPAADSRAADVVVDEIRALGGRAAPDYESVLDGERIVRTALDEFGRIDILINNAGIIRDVTFGKMTHDDWKSVLKVHLQGAFECTKAAWPHMQRQQYGRVLFTSSNAGVYGNFGQCNYASAKSALHGFSHSLALEGRKHGIQANVLVPSASTRISQSLLSEEQRKALKPEFITPLVVFLCSRQCAESGGVFEAGGAHFGQIKTFRTRGLVIAEPTPEKVRDGWTAITDQENPLSFGSFFEASAAAIKSGLASLGVVDKPEKPAK